MKRVMQAAALFSALGVGTAAQAALVTFEVDPTQSVISLGQSINIGDTNSAGGEFNQGYPQVGGESQSYSGTFEADIVGNTINFLGGPFDIVASNSLTPLLPGGTPGNYGFVTLGGDSAALRNFRFTFKKDVTAQPFNVGPNGVLLDPARDNWEYGPDVDASWTRSTDSLRSGVFEEDFHLSNPPTGAKLTQIPGGYKLEIPVQVNITWAELGANDSQFELVGKIVATSVVPEPGAMSVLLIGGAALLGRRRRNR